MAMMTGTAGQTPDVVLNGMFHQGSQSWTLTAGWTFNNDPKGLIHTAGITTVSQDCTKATHTTVTYVVDIYTSGITAGTVTSKVGSGDTGEIISTNGAHSFEAVFNTDTVFSLTPTTDFDGLIQYVRIREKK